jgi:voltage-gated potassium channel
VALGATRILIRRLRWLFVVVAAVLLYGIAGYTLLEHWSFLDAIYMTITTLTTVGFREVRPLDAGGRIFTMTLIAFGAGLVLVSVSLVAGWIAEGDWGVEVRRRRMHRRIDAMSDHYVLCAYGRVGRAVAREFEAAGVPFVVVDPKESLEERMQQDGVVYLTEDPSEEAVLLRAGIDRAKGLVCAVDSDATNVYIALTARSMSKDLFIVARASEPGSDDRLRRAGADRVVSPFVSSGRHMALVAMRPLVADVLEVESPGASSLRLEEVTVEPGSALDGTTIGEMRARTPVLALRSGDGSVEPHPADDRRLSAGDLVLLLGEQEVLANAREDQPPQP